MMNPKSFLSTIFLGLSLRNAVVPVKASTVTFYSSNPDGFFDESSPTLYYKPSMYSMGGGKFHLQMTTPLPTLCALLHTEGDGTDDTTAFTKMETMVMSEPTTAHDVALPSVENGKTYSFMIAAFLPPEKTMLDNDGDDYLAQTILRSSTYEITTDSSAATQPLSPSDTSGATVFAQSLDSPSCPYTLSTNEITSSSVSFALSSNPMNNPTTHSVTHMQLVDDEDDSMKTNGDGVYQSRYGASNRPQYIPSLSLLGLEGDSSYLSSACFIDITSKISCTNQVSFATSKDETANDSKSCRGPNKALLSLGASISAVSSNYANMGLSSSFGGNKAIDGSPQSSWSSNGNGNNAYIAVKLAEEILFEGVGVWSRTMTTSAVIQSFSITLSKSSSMEKVTLGPFDLESADEMYTYSIWENEENNVYKNQKYDVVRLDVVTSSGGNTGLRTLEVYPRLSKGEVNEIEGTVCDDGDGDDADLDETETSGRNSFYGGRVGWMIGNVILVCMVFLL